VGGEGLRLGAGERLSRCEVEPDRASYRASSQGVEPGGGATRGVEWAGEGTSRGRAFQWPPRRLTGCKADRRRSESRRCSVRSVAGLNDGRADCTIGTGGGGLNSNMCSRAVAALGVALIRVAELPRRGACSLARAALKHSPPPLPALRGEMAIVFTFGTIFGGLLATPPDVGACTLAASAPWARV
jgi:hypothetical protein